MSGQTTGVLMTVLWVLRGVSLGPNAPVAYILPWAVAMRQASTMPWRIASRVSSAVVATPSRVRIRVA